MAAWSFISKTLPSMREASTAELHPETTQVDIIPETHTPENCYEVAVTITSEGIVRVMDSRATAPQKGCKIYTL